MNKVPVGKDALFGPPEIALHCGGAGLGAMIPAGGIFRLRKEVGKVFQIALIAVEQAIEAHRRVVMRGSVEGAKAKAGIEAGFAHGAVAEIEVAAEPVTGGPCPHAHHAGVDVATGQLQSRCLGRIGMFGTFDQKTVAALLWMRDQPANDIGIVGAVVGHLRHRAGPIIEVARQSGHARLVLRAHPGGVVFLGQRIGAFEPGSGLKTAGRSGRKAGWILIHRADHRC